MDDNRVQEVTTPFGHFVCWKNDRISDQLRRFGAHSRNELAMVLDCLRPGDRVIDVGAHIGTFSVPFAQRVGETGLLVSFEADPANFGLLERNIRDNGLAARVRLVHGVASDQDGVYEKGYTSEGNSGTHSFVPAAGGHGGVHSVRVESWWDRECPGQPVHLIKVDTEGAEVAVLRACRSLIEKFRPILYIEVAEDALRRFGDSADAIDAFLKPFGYRYYRNIGQRNSGHDRYRLARLSSVREGGRFYDLLAIHPDSGRCPACRPFVHPISRLQRLYHAGVETARWAAGKPGKFYRRLTGRTAR
jgi:FkbM family methyltransferase